MDIDSILNEIDIRRNEFRKNDYGLTELLKFITQLRLDWGFYEGEYTEKFDIGVTKPILLSGLSGDSSNIKRNERLFEKRLEESMLIRSFLFERRLTKDVLKGIHSQIIAEGGEFRKNGVKINDSNKRVLVEFSNYDEIDNHIELLIEWLNKELLDNEIHPVLLGAIFHHKLVLIHPFDNGNGRLARIISSLIFLHFNIPPPIVTEEDRSDYIFSLRNADTGNINPFLKFIAKRILFAFNIISSFNTSGNE